MTPAKIEVNQDKRSVEPARLQCSWVTTVDAFRDLEAGWMELFARAGRKSAFLGFDWMFLWWKHWGAGRKLAIVTVRDQTNRLVAVAPFYMARFRSIGPRRLSFLADEHVGSDYLNLLVEPGLEEAAVSGIVDLLRRGRRNYDYIDLRDGEDSPLFHLFTSRLRAVGMTLRTERASICPYIALPSSFDGFLGALSGNLRGNFRRRWRNLQRDHQAEFVVISGPDGVDRHFDELLTLHRMRFRQRGEESAFLKPGVPEFHREAARAMAALGWSRIFLVRVDSKTVAALYGFSIDGAFQFFQCGMDTGWHKMFGLGQVLMGNTIRETIETGHGTFDFLRGDEPYKSGWTDRSRHTLTVRCFDSSPASRIANCLFVLKGWLRRARVVAARRIASLRASAKPAAPQAGSAE